MQPAEFVCAILKVDYGTRYGSVGARDYIGGFRDGIGEADLSKIVAHCDGVAAKMEEGAPALVLGDDLSPEEGVEAARQATSGRCRLSNDGALRLQAVWRMAECRPLTLISNSNTTGQEK